MAVRLTGLWRNPDFLKLWAGQTVSAFGDQVSLLALPLTAVLVLGATPAQMGFLGAAETAPYLLVGLFAGVWVDRLRRRPIMIVADLGRAALLGSIPVSAAFDLLRVEQLYAVGFLVGVLNVFFAAANQATLPSVVEREQLVEGNSKFALSRSLARIAGPGATGGLVQLVTAPVVIVLDALSFVVSALCVAFIRRPEPGPPASAQHRGIWREIGEGLRLLGHPLRRAIAGSAGTFNCFATLLSTVYVLYVTRELGITPAALGLILTVGAPGALLGALLGGRALQRFGIGPVMLGGLLLAGASRLVIPLASGPAIAVVALLIAAQFLYGLGTTLYDVNSVSLQQAITPDRYLGRTRASMSVIVAGTMPIGALIGGALGQSIGLRFTLAVGAIGSLFAVAWIAFSPARALREAPQPSEQPALAVG